MTMTEKDEYMNWNWKPDWRDTEHSILPESQVKVRVKANTATKQTGRTPTY